MVKLSALIVLFLSFSLFLWSGEFTAQVKNTQVNLHENFTLNLVLKDASPKEVPDFSVLKEHFIINTQQNLTNTTIINGKVSASIIWKLSLTPIKEGTVELPPIAINTAEGTLSTQALSFNVVKGNAASSNTESMDPNLSAKVSNSSPYKNEPFTFTVVLSSQLPFYDVQTQKIQLEDAIVEILEQPKQEQKVIEGVLQNVIELTYLITPLKSGTLTIPSMMIQGAVPQTQKKRDSRSLFDDDADPFAFMQGFSRLKRFNAVTEEMHVNILPPNPEVSPWLPAKSLTIEEQWPSDQLMRVGEPFSRSFTISAQGLKTSQLPHLEELQTSDKNFKIYADKPEEQEHLSQGHIQSTRKVQLTLIPQQVGSWTLPEITVNWWDSVNKEKKSAIIPSRTIQILPTLESPTNTSLQNDSINETANLAINDITHFPPPIWLYNIIGVLALSLLAALLWGFSLQRKISRLTQSSPPKSNKTSSAIPKKKILPTPLTNQNSQKEKLTNLNPT